MLQVAHHGIHATTVGLVVRSARVTRERFYELHATLRDCYLDALAPLVGALRIEAARGAAAAAESVEGFERSMVAMLRLLAGDEDRTYCLLFEPADPDADPTFSDGPARQALVGIIDRLFDGHGAAAADAYAAMLHQMIAQRVVSGRCHELPEVAQAFGDLLRTHRTGLRQQAREREAG